MTYASYERQHLALYAAGFISGDGNTTLAHGCEMTRVGTGIYAVVFGADAGLVNDNSWTTVTPKLPLGQSGGPNVIVGVEDTSNVVKTIFARGLTTTTGGTLVLQDVNVALEVAVYRTVLPGS